MIAPASHGGNGAHHPLLFPHLVVPGQIIAVSAPGEETFLRGHGTYLDDASHAHTDTDDNDDSHLNATTQQQQQQVLRAAVTGTVQRVNKLISVDSVSLMSYTAQTGDLVVGRILSIGNARWHVSLGSHGLTASLPLSGVHLPGGIQRMRTGQDALEMRGHLQEGDLVSAEVHKILASSVMLHTRSVRYGKLENGSVVTVPARLIPRLKSHYTSICQGQFQILLGCNGMIWMQRHQQHGVSGGSTVEEGMIVGQQELAEAEEARRKQHAETPYSREERLNLARLRCSILCLQQTLTEITPEAIEDVYAQSTSLRVADMLLPDNVIRLTAGRRSL